jgi:hypothetical protein
VTDLLLDTNDEQRVRLNFNITMMDLKCEYAVVDVVSVLGTEQNVSSHVTKWHVDSEGVRQRYQGRNKQQKDIDLFDKSVTETIEELYDNGEDAVNLSQETFDFARKTQEYLFVDFYASWYVGSAFMRDGRRDEAHAVPLLIFGFVYLAFNPPLHGTALGALIAAICIRPGRRWQNS